MRTLMLATVSWIDSLTEKRRTRGPAQPAIGNRHHLSTHASALSTVQRIVQIVRKKQFSEKMILLRASLRSRRSRCQAVLWGFRIAKENCLSDTSGTVSYSHLRLRQLQALTERLTSTLWVRDYQRTNKQGNCADHQQQVCDIEIGPYPLIVCLKENPIAHGVDWLPGTLGIEAIP